MWFQCWCRGIGRRIKANSVDKAKYDMQTIIWMNQAKPHLDEISAEKLSANESHLAEEELQALQTTPL